MWWLIRRAVKTNCRVPAWTSWYAHLAPLWVHTSSAFITFVIELVVPFGALLPSRFRRIRLSACVVMCLLQIGIALSGNYGFFNLLTIVLYLSMLDDRTIGRLLPAALSQRVSPGRRPSDVAGETTPVIHTGRGARVWRVALVVVTPVIAFVSFICPFALFLSFAILDETA